MQADDGAGRWFTIAEVAPLLGVSVDTVRRRLKRGQLEARQVHTQHGPTWEVCLGDLQGHAAAVPMQAAQGAAEGPAMLEALRLVDRLQRENRELAERVGFLHAQLGEARERIRMLEAPKEPEPMPVPEPAPYPAPMEPGPDGPVRGPSPPPSEGGSAPWWSRWWGWLNGS
jgi:excisionase family DNA binding protein